MIYLLGNKGVDEECASSEPLREVAVGASDGEWDVFVASEPGGRKPLVSRTSP